MLSVTGLLTKISGLAFRVILNRMISGSADIVAAAGEYRRGYSAYRCGHE